jgi:Protein of unknown function (DUF1360)
MLTLFFIVSLAVFAMSTTIATTPLLDAIRRKAYERSALWGKLVSCPYCLSHWLAAVFVPLSGLKLVPGSFVVTDWLISLFAVVGMGAIFDILLDLRSRLK